MGVPQNKRDAKRIVRDAFAEVKAKQEALTYFGRVCKLVHDQNLLCDREIAETIDHGYSRSNIHLLRKKAQAEVK